MEEGIVGFKSVSVLKTMILVPEAFPQRDILSERGSMSLPTRPKVLASGCKWPLKQISFPAPLSLSTGFQKDLK